MMQLKILSRRTLLITAIAGLVFILVFVFSLIVKSSVLDGSALVVENTVASPKQKQPSFGLPVRLKIPVINVNSAVEYIGLTSDGAMGVPKERSNVAWFNLGPRPGEEGSAVIAGHYGIKNGKASVFDNLYKLRKGDKLYVEDDKGMIIFFVVSEVRRYDPNADASGVFSSSDGKSHLNLITCEGVWDKGVQQYPERLVIFTDKETE